MAASNRAGDSLLESLRQSIRHSINEHHDAMLKGCGDHAGYEHLRGIIIGLAIAERELLDLDEKLRKNS